MWFSPDARLPEDYLLTFEDFKQNNAWYTIVT